VSVPITLSDLKRRRGGSRGAYFLLGSAYLRSYRTYRLMAEPQHSPVLRPRSTYDDMDRSVFRRSATPLHIAQCVMRFVDDSWVFDSTLLCIVCLIGTTSHAPTLRHSCTLLRWLKWGGRGGSAPLLPFEPPAIVWAPWLNL